MNETLATKLFEYLDARRAESKISGNLRGWLEIEADSEEDVWHFWRNKTART
jgi:hypothetical protein